jgi:hypothetical protein
MKKLILLLIICTSGLMSQTATAQISFRVNLGLQPAWGPAGYDHVDYYYLPDIEAYYYVPTHRYYYQENGRWVNRLYLPSRYRNYDLYHARKIVINGRNPYLRHNEYRQRYQRSNGNYNQRSIRDSRQSGYSGYRNQPQRSQMRGNSGNYGQRGGQGNRGGVNREVGNRGQGNGGHGNRGNGNGGHGNKGGRK